jgi:putative tryptophan/tyrosine transport system substrate-binding protein
MKRREFITLLGGTVVGWPALVSAQQLTNVARIGYLMTGTLKSPEARALLDSFRQGLRERGLMEGQNIIIEYRAAEGKFERFPSLASDLVRLNPDLIVAPNTPASRAVQQATTMIPIVVQAMGDPVGDGLVASLARPGGNITGLTFLGPELVVKRLDLLKQALPNLSRLAGLWHPGAYGEHATSDMLKATEVQARTLGLQLQLVAVQDAEDFDRAFSAITGQRAEALLVFPSPMLFIERKRLVDLAAKQRLPSMFAAREFVELGGLMAYGASIADLFRKSAVYVDKILRGAKPANLPVEQPTKFELVINLNTAKALGLTIPPSIMVQADEVIE